MATRWVSFEFCGHLNKIGCNLKREKIWKRQIVLLFCASVLGRWTIPISWKIQHFFKLSTARSINMTTNPHGHSSSKCYSTLRKNKVLSPQPINDNYHTIYARSINDYQSPLTLIEQIMLNTKKEWSSQYKANKNLNGQNQADSVTITHEKT